MIPEGPLLFRGFQNYTCVPTRFLRILYFNTRSYVTLQFANIHQLKNQVKIEVNLLDLLQIPTV